MKTYLIRQAFSSLLSLAIVTVGVFLLLRLFGDPVPNLIPDATPAQAAELRQQLGLSAPIYEQLGAYLADLVRGNFGESYYDRRPVLPKILDHFAISAKLILGGVLLAAVIGIPLGVVAAVFSNTIWDRLISIVTIVGQSMPTFWIGIVFILIFAVNLGWLPAYGIHSPTGWILPIATIGIFSMARFTLTMRVSLLDELGNDYVRTARSKGLSEFAVILHAVRNALIPVVTMMGFRVAELITSSVVVEVVFGIHGIGQVLVYDGVFRRDFPLVQAGVVFVAALIIGINLLTEWFYTLIDPRIQH